MIKPIFLVMVLSSLFSFCGASANHKSTLVTLQTSRALLSITAEIADTPEETAQGLMNRKTLAKDHGMLFIFDGASQRAFWMKNTYIPLDIIFIGADKIILYIAENATPLSETPIAPQVQTQYVLEVNTGYVTTNGLNVGDEVRFQ